MSSAAWAWRARCASATAELDAVEDPASARQLFQRARRADVRRSARRSAWRRYFEIDDVIDPADTRRWITALLDAAPAPLPRAGKKRPNIDTW